MLKKLKKLKGRSLQELRVRSRQAIAAQAERHGLSRAATIPLDDVFFKLLNPDTFAPTQHRSESLLEHFRIRKKPHFFPGFDDEDKSCLVLETRFAGGDEALCNRAERILEGRFDLLGFHGLHFGSPVDWGLDPIKQVRVPLVHWSAIDFLDPEIAGDKKIAWELNRHQFFQTLGRAYWRTRDERFAQAFVDYAKQWIEANPPKLGLNWASSLEVAFRAISWVWAVHFFKRSPALTPPTFLLLVKVLYLHARHLETYLSTYFSPNTHLTGEALGLFYLGSMFPEFSEASRWRQTGETILLTQLDRHVREDGVYFEQSSYYHRYTTDFYLHLCALMRANDQQPDQHLVARLTALLDHLMYISRPDGTTPFVGDDDGGRLVMLDERPANDFRATLSNGAALLHRSDYKYVAGDVAEETLWLLGPAGVADFDGLQAQRPVETSRAFVDGGYYVMRDGWARDANYMLVDCGPHGAEEINCGHAHANTLSFDLAAAGRSVLIDPGTHTYTGSAEWRDYFRSSTSHNTLTVDGCSSSIPAKSAFRWQHVARPRHLSWYSRDRFDFFEGEHDGYMRLAAPAKHNRSILFLKPDYWIVRDVVETVGEHCYDLRFQFAADAAPCSEGTAEWIVLRDRRKDGSGLEILTIADRGEWLEDKGWVSPVYGQRLVAPAFRFRATGKGITEFVTFLVPRKSGETTSLRARMMETGRGRGVELERSEMERDLILFGDSRSEVVANGLRSDFRWSWLRFDSNRQLKELVLIDGAKLALEDGVTFRAKTRAPFVSARRSQNDWEIDSPAAIDVSVTGV